MADPHTAAGAAAPGPAHDDASLSVQQRLENADKLTSLSEAKAEVHHAEPLFLGFAPPMMVVAAAMAIFIIILLVKRVPGIITGTLDGQIEAIRKQLEDAKALRAEAEALREEYAAKIAGAEKDAAAMLDHARHESEAIVARAEAETTEVVARREKMATDRIEAAERAAIDELRARASTAAAGAARQLIAGNLGAERDKALVDGAIAGI